MNISACELIKLGKGNKAQTRLLEKFTASQVELNKLHPYLGF